MALSQQVEVVASRHDLRTAVGDTPFDESERNNTTGECPILQQVNAGGNTLADGLAPNNQQRLEALIEQQNALLLQQIQLAEKSAERQRASLLGNRPHEFVKTLDPYMKLIFARWKNSFLETLAIYVSQSRKHSKLEAVASQGDLVQPFSRESRQAWRWPVIYSSVAQPLQHTGFDTGDSSDSVGVSDNSDVHPALETYDVNQAFEELRQKHAWESQTFVLGHSKACVEKLLEALSLDCQVKRLQEQIATGIAEQKQCYPAQAKEGLEAQAIAYVEAVHRVEMQKAEKKIKEDFTFPFLMGIRLVVVMTVILAATTMSYESLTRVFAILFGLGCGMALLWEDVLILSVRLLLGQSIKRIDSFREQASQIQINLPITFWQ